MGLRTLGVRPTGLPACANILSKLRHEAIRLTRIGHYDAVNLVLTHHYAGSYPVKMRYRLVERRSRRLVGVCTIGTPCNQKVLSNPLPKLAAAKRVAELNRLVLLDEVESNDDSA